MDTLPIISGRPHLPPTKDSMYRLSTTHPTGECRSTGATSHEVVAHLDAVLLSAEGTTWNTCSLSLMGRSCTVEEVSKS